MTADRARRGDHRRGGDEPAAEKPWPLPGGSGRREAAFTDAEAREAWNRGADPWREFVRSGADYYRIEVHGPGLLRACLPVAGLRVLDLGCGEGWFSRELARSGARVTGVDLSEAQLDHALALERETPLGIRYLRLAAAEVASRWEAGAFDLVTACMAIQDMSDPRSVLRAARRVLDPGHRMVFSVPHPATDTAFREWERDPAGAKIALRIDGYFDSGPGVLHWDMPRLTGHWSTPRWRFTLSEWAEIVRGSGFRLRGLHEPRPTEEQVRRRPELDDCRRLPYFLVFELAASSPEPPGDP